MRAVFEENQVVGSHFCVLILKEDVLEKKKMSRGPAEA
jgi:hypothetical protein